jgi:hypothetical protein
LAFKKVKKYFQFLILGERTIELKVQDLAYFGFVNPLKIELDRRLLNIVFRFGYDGSYFRVNPIKLRFSSD